MTAAAATVPPGVAATLGRLAQEFPTVTFAWSRALGYKADFGDGSDPAVSPSSTALKCYVALTLHRRGNDGNGGL